MGQTIACSNQKGGVGKTTTVVNLATYLALLGDRVLVIDLDPQGNATSGFGIDKSAVDGSIYDALIAGRPLAELHIPTAVDGLRIVPSAIALAGAEVELVNEEGRERRLARAIAAERDAWDWILVDCPPSLGLLTLNSLTAANSVLIPVQAEYFALEGLGQLLNTIKIVRQHLNPELEIEGVLMTMFDIRLRLSNQVASEVRRYFGDKVFKTIVQRNVRISEAPSFGKPVILYDATSIGSRNYIALAREILHNNQRYLQQPEVQEEADGGGSDGQHGVSSPPRPPTPANGFAL